jgi:hypothetical protein
MYLQHNKGKTTATVNKPEVVNDIFRHKKQIKNKTRAPLHSHLNPGTGAAPIRSRTLKIFLVFAISFFMSNHDQKDREEGVLNKNMSVQKEQKLNETIL